MKILSSFTHTQVFPKLWVSFFCWTQKMIFCYQTVDGSHCIFFFFFSLHTMKVSQLFVHQHSSKYLFIFRRKKLMQVLNNLRVRKWILIFGWNIPLTLGYSKQNLGLSWFTFHTAYNLPVLIYIFAVSLTGRAQCSISWYKSSSIVYVRIIHCWPYYQVFFQTIKVRIKVSSSLRLTASKLQVWNVFFFTCGKKWGLEQQ